MENYNKDAKLNFVKEGTIFIHGGFDETISFDVLSEFDKLIKDETDKKEGKITIDICSSGGYIRDLLNLLSRVELAKSSGITVETIVSSYAYSCGSMLACSGTKGHRFVFEHSEHLCHLGSAGFRVYNDIELDREIEGVKYHFDFVRSTYKKYANIPELSKVIKDDRLFVRGDKIIKWGLADKFINEKMN